MDKQIKIKKRNIKNLKENNEILNLIQKEYINAGNIILMK